jgi:hypothetical protein
MGKRKNTYYANLNIDGYAALIRKALEEKGNYKDSLELTIHMLASCLVRYAQIQTKFDKAALMLRTRSREGSYRYSINPLFVMQEHQGEQIRKYLRELKLTISTSSADSGEDGENTELSKLCSVISGGESSGPRLLRPLKTGTK